MQTRVSNVHDLAFSPDGKTLAVAGGTPGESGGFELLAWPDGDSVAKVSSLPDVAHEVAWLDGQRLALAGHDGKIVVSDRDGSNRRSLVGHSRPVLTLTTIADAKLLVTGSSDQSVRLWDLESGELKRTLANHTGDVRDLAAMPAGSSGPPIVASGGADKTVRFWQPTIGRLVRFARLKSAPLAIAFTPDGRLLLAACEDGKLRAIDPQTAQITFETAAIDGWATTLLADANGRVLVGGEHGQLKVIELDSAAAAHERESP